MDFYYLPTSPPCHAVLMVAEALGVELNKKVLNTLAGEQMTPEFIKINPQHTIPTLVDSGFSVWESRAISVYLVEKYGREDSLYPKDPQQRAVVNQRLYFDMGTLSQSFANYYYPQFLHNKPADPEKYAKIMEAMDFLNTFLAGQKFVAGSRLTVADFSILASISSFVVAQFDLSKYTNVVRWYEETQKVAPCFSVGVAALQKWVDAKLKANKHNAEN